MRFGRIAARANHHQSSQWAGLTGHGTAAAARRTHPQPLRLLARSMSCRYCTHGFATLISANLVMQYSLHCFICIYRSRLLFPNLQTMPQQQGLGQRMRTLQQQSESLCTLSAKAAGQKPFRISTGTVTGTFSPHAPAGSLLSKAYTDTIHFSFAALITMTWCATTSTTYGGSLWRPPRMTKCFPP